MLIATLHALLNMCSFRTDAMLFHILRKIILYLLRPQHFYGYHFASIVGNLKSVSLSEVASDNTILLRILMQSYIKISQLFHKLLEHIQSHPPTHTTTHTYTHTHTHHTHTHTHAHARTRTHARARGKYDQRYENNFV